MPAWPSRTNLALPECLTRFRCLPQCKVPRIVLLILILVDSRAVAHSRKIPFRELAVFRKRRDAEVVGAVFSLVCMPLLHEFGDKVCHFVYVLRCTHNPFRSLEIQSAAIFEKRLLKFRSVLPYADVIARGVADNLVVHIGDVHHVVQLIATAAQKAAQNVHCDEGTEVPDMPVVIDRWATRVHPDLVRLNGAELLEFCRECVEKS